MVTKAIVEGYKDQYSVIVRIPYVDKSSESGVSTPKKELNSATICTLPNTELNLVTGDVVFVSFEDNDYSKPVIVGVLSRKAGSNSFVDVRLNSLNIRNKQKDPSISAAVTDSKNAIMSSVTSGFTSVNEDIDDLAQSYNSLDSRVTALEGGSIGTVVHFEEVQW